MAFLKKSILLAGLTCLVTPTFAEIPYLKHENNCTKLIVDGKPFLMRAGELGNSTASNPRYLSQFWDKFDRLNLNSIVAPVYWELIEPEEGNFDFSTVNELITDARSHNKRLVLLWFGSWKNSMSCYTPAWIKTNPERFPRTVDTNGNRQEILSPFSENNLKADGSAFSELMQHLKEIDGEENTVVMVQVENEIGMIPCARDHSPLADKAFETDVPKELLAYLKSNKGNLTPELDSLWRSTNYTDNGTWTDVFGDSAQAEEVFMAWYFAKYTNIITEAGKAEYKLPMYVNAALIRPGYQPGQYPGSGPLPHLFDIWFAAAPSLDFLSPDIYFPNFVHWVDKYVTKGNPLFIPEHRNNNMASVNAFYAFAEHDSMGFSPFAIESINGDAEWLLRDSYKVLEQLEPIMLEHMGDGSMIGLLKGDPEHKREQRIRLGNYQFNVEYQSMTPTVMKDNVVFDAAGAEDLPAGGLAIQTGPNEFIFAGIGMVITFDHYTNAGKQVGILSAEEGIYENGKWKNTLWLNGDQTHQGRHIRLLPGKFSIQRVKLYEY